MACATAACIWFTASEYAGEFMYAIDQSLLKQFPSLSLEYIFPRTFYTLGRLVPALEMRS